MHHRLFAVELSVVLRKELFWDHDVPILRLSGSLAGEDCDSVREQAVGCCARTRRGLAINLAGVDSMDQEGRGTLIEILAYCLKSGVRLALVDQWEHCSTLLGSDRLLRLFTSFVSDAEAVAHFADIPSPAPSEMASRPGSAPFLQGTPEVDESGLQIREVTPAGPQPTTDGVPKGSYWQQKAMRGEAPAAERYVGTRALLEVIHPTWGTRLVSPTKSPFLIGRGRDSDLLLLDERISRQCAALLCSEEHFFIEDCGNQSGVFVNGEKITRRELHGGDTISFGLTQSYSLCFHIRDDQMPVDLLVSRFESAADLEPRARSLSQLSLLLEAAALMQSQLPLNDVLSAVVDRAIELTGADRGILYQVRAQGDLQPVLARQHGARHLETGSVQFSPQVRLTLARALEEHKSITETVTLPSPVTPLGEKGGAAPGMSWIIIPLLMPPQPSLPVPEERQAPHDILGLLYLDSFNPLTFGCNDGRVLNAMAVQAASVMANAHLAQKEFERQQLVQELSIARRIQQALLPKEFKEYAHLQVTGISKSCSAVGGDYFDFIDFGGGQTAFIVADVSGHGLGAALLSTMLQGTFTAMALGLKPASIFKNTNRFICEHAEVGRHATLFFGLLAPDGRLEYVNAGHWPPLLLRQDQLTPVFRAASIPVGLIASAEFASMSDTLLPGDTLILYSDGIIEATDAQNTEFGMAGLRKAISLCAGRSVKDLQDSILAALDRFTSGTSQADDITLLILRYTG